MPWDRSRPRGGQTHPRYRTKEHRDTAARLRAQLERDGSGLCAEPVCVKSSRLITPSMDLHVCHDRATGAVLGLGHAACNRSEAGRYARRVQEVIRIRL